MMPSSSFSFCSKRSLPSRNEALGPRGEVVFEVVEVGRDRRAASGRRVGEVAEDVQIVERRERAADRFR